MVSRFSRPSAERQPTLTFPEDDVEAVTRLTLVEDHMSTRKIDRLKLFGGAATAEGSTP